MHPRYPLAVIFMVSILLTSCVSFPSSQPVETISGTPVEMPAGESPSPTGLYANLQQELSRQLNTSIDQLQISNLEEVEWPNSCFGLPQPGEACAEMITPGYRGLVTVGDRQYEFRSSTSGQSVRLIPGAVANAIQDLSQQTGITAAGIQIDQVEQVDWPDGCLGINTAGQMCTQAITPGYRIVLSANGEIYEYHTDLNGSQVILITGQQPQSSPTVLTWAWLHEGACESSAISFDYVLYGACGEPQTKGQFVLPKRQSDLLNFTERYAPFEAETPAGKILFSSQGNQIATPTEQRMIAEWARLVSQETATGSYDPARGLVYTWHRQGGFAGFCNNLVIYTDGEALGSDCSSNQVVNHNSYRLNSVELEKLYAWVDNYQSFALEQNDPAVADAMQISLKFSGNGKETADPAVQREMLDMLTQIYNQTLTP